MTEVNDALQIERKTLTCHIYFKEFGYAQTLSLSLYRLLSKSSPKQLQSEITNTRPHIHCFLQLK